MRDQLVPWQDFADTFEETERQVPVPADSLLGEAMAEYRERLARGEVEPLDPDFKVTPVPVDPAQE